MNQEKDPQDMKPEYDIRGGVRGKYLERYRQGVTMVITITPDTKLTVENSPFVWIPLASTPDVGKIAKAAVYPPAWPSPNVPVLRLHEATPAPR